MGRVWIDGSAFRTGPTPETVKLLREAQEACQLYKKSKLFRFRRLLGRLLPQQRHFVDPTSALRRVVVELRAHEKAETEVSWRRIRNFKGKSLQAA